MATISFIRRLLLRHHHCRPFSAAPAAATTATPFAEPLSATPFAEPLTATINNIFKIRDPDDLAAAFIAASTSSYRFRCHHNVYLHAITRLAASGRHNLIHSLIQSQTPFLSSDPTRVGFSLRLLSLYSMARMPSHATELFHNLPTLGCPRTTKSFNALLTAFAKSSQYDDMINYFRKIPAADPDIKPDIFSYNILIKAFCEKSDLDAAFETIAEMEGNGICPDLITMNTMLKWCYEGGRVDYADKVWGLMREKGICPNSKCFNAKLRWLIAEGEVGKVEEIVSEMKRVGEPKPDTYSFNALISGYCREGRLEEAKRVFSELVVNDCVPNKGTFEALVPFLCRDGELDLAVRCVYDSMSRKCFLDSAVLQQVVDALVKASRVEEATKVVELCRKNKYSRKSLRMPSENNVS